VDLRGKLRRNKKAGSYTKNKKKKRRGWKRREEKGSTKGKELIVTCHKKESRQKSGWKDEKGLGIDDGTKVNGAANGVKEKDGRKNRGAKERNVQLENKGTESKSQRKNKMVRSQKLGFGRSGTPEKEKAEKEGQAGRHEIFHRGV